MFSRLGGILWRPEINQKNLKWKLNSYEIKAPMWLSGNTKKAGPFLLYKKSIKIVVA